MALYDQLAICSNYFVKRYNYALLMGDCAPSKTCARN
jgi:hypothetical protein